MLIVEDNRDLRLALDVQIRHFGLCTSFAADPESAIRALDRQPPALVLLDLALGEGDGFEVLRRIRGDETLEHLPVVVLTGRAKHPNEADSLRAGADLFLSKPVSPGQLRRVLRRYIAF